jgi:predicted NBD/HSP70 family sugar kinase
VIFGQDELGQRSETVRRGNLGAIVRELHARGPLSRSELVARTGLTRSTIRKLIHELGSAGLVSEEPAIPLGTPGRPSPLVRLNPEGAVVLALEISVDSLAAAVVGLGGEVLEQKRIDRRRGHSSVEAIVADLVGLTTVVRRRRPADDPLIGVGVGVVGVVRRADGLVATAPNLGWRDVPLGERLDEGLGLSVPISVANDADLGALAEVRRGSAIGLGDVLFLRGEVGVGGGVILAGRPMTGVAGYGGEVGHFPVNPLGLPCRCGSIGCWETEVGEDALLMRAGYRAGGGRRDVERVLRDATAGSPQALAALDHIGMWLGRGLAGLINIFNPSIVVLGGLFGRILPFVAASMELEIDRRTLPAPRSLVRIVPAALGVNAPLIGAAELAFAPILADPAVWVGPRDATVELASA